MDRPRPGVHGCCHQAAPPQSPASLSNGYHCQSYCCWPWPWLDGNAPMEAPRGGRAPSVPPSPGGTRRGIRRFGGVRSPPAAPRREGSHGESARARSTPVQSRGTSSFVQSSESCSRFLVRVCVCGVVCHANHTHFEFFFFLLVRYERQRQTCLLTRVDGFGFLPVPRAREVSL